MIFFFLLLCFPSRLLLAYIAYLIQNKSKYSEYKTFFNIFIGIIILWFIISPYLYNVWYNKIKLITIFNFLFYEVLVLSEFKHAYLFLLLDAVIGLYMHFVHYYQIYSMFFYKIYKQFIHPFTAYSINIHKLE